MSAINFEILSYDDTPLGPLCLRRRELLSEPGTIVTEVSLNHEFLMSSYNTASERALARVALEMLPGEGLDVLVGGLGLGYTAREALVSDRVARVEVVEFLPQVIGWLDRCLIPLSSELKSDARLKVVQADVYRLLSEPPARTYDLILIDVDHSPEDRLAAANGTFYTEEGLARARKHLKPGGVLGVWSYDESAPFSGVLRRVFREVRIEPVEFKNRLVGETQTDWLFFAR
ncbi:MAG: spermidine synthase [Elusimicrobia bacterium CG11_big_fil_rev_8_21_14_0_20_64_6]|nr:MAG: spermidine synthase [Elusimicrobia bacterium CG11_big_fil_rev_8_21_14_0_20_64_6]